MSSNNYEKAQEQWDSFCENIKYQQRYFISHPVLDILKSVAKSCKMIIDPGKIYYRARIIDHNAAKKEHMVARCFGPDSTETDQKWYHDKANKFRGLSKEGSYVPPDPNQIKDARSNPKYIRYLYVAESPTTAVFEVRPILHNAVNVSGIQVKKRLVIADIAVDIDMNPEKEKSMEEWLLCFIQSAFSSPTNNPDDYLSSQIIAEYFRYLGYDGIRYSSSLHRGGYNLTIYDVSKCEAVFSTDLRLENIKIYLRPAIGAENIDGRFEYIVDNIPMRMDKATGQMIEAQI